jgi:hypothetical protein
LDIVLDTSKTLIPVADDVKLIRKLQIAKKARDFDKTEKKRRKKLLLKNCHAYRSMVNMYERAQGKDVLKIDDGERTRFYHFVDGEFFLMLLFSDESEVVYPSKVFHPVLYVQRAAVAEEKERHKDGYTGTKTCFESNRVDAAMKETAPLQQRPSMFAQQSSHHHRHLRHHHRHHRRRRRCVHSSTPLSFMVAPVALMLLMRIR